MTKYYKVSEDLLNRLHMCALINREIDLQDESGEILDNVPIPEPMTDEEIRMAFELELPDLNLKRRESGIYEDNYAYTLFIGFKAAFEFMKVRNG